MDHLIPFFRNPKYELVQSDIRNGEELGRAMRGVDVIIHLAAIVGYPACNADPRLAREVNIEGTAVLNKLRSPSQLVIFASTGSCYGAVESGVCGEDTPLHPLTLYGMSKMQGEQILHDTGNVISYRFATAFGLSPRLRLDLLINDFCYQAIHHRTLILFEAHFRRSFIHVYDIAHAFVHALDNHTYLRDEIYNCGSSELNASKLEIAELIKKQTNLYFHVAEVGKDEDQRNYDMSYTKIQNTGFSTTIDLPTGISEMIKALRFLHIPDPYRNGRI